MSVDCSNDETSVAGLVFGVESCSDWKLFIHLPSSEDGKASLSVRMSFSDR